MTDLDMDAQELLSTEEDTGSAHDFEPELPEEPLPHPNEETMPNRLRHNESFDSIFDENGVESGDRQSISSRHSDSVPLMTLPHSTYNPQGTNDLYSIILIINAALGAGTYKSRSNHCFQAHNFHTFQDS